LGAATATITLRQTRSATRDRADAPYDRRKCLVRLQITASLPAGMATGSGHCAELNPIAVCSDGATMPHIVNNRGAGPRIAFQ
jgi:hypothetical protein